MPLPPYIKVSVTRDLRHLLISPELSADAELTDDLIAELRGAWLAINSEYTEIVGEAEAMGYTGELHRSNELRSRLLRLRMTVEATKMLPHPEFVAILEEEDFGLELNPDDPAQFAADLERVLVELIADELELQGLEAKLDKKEEAGKSGGVTEAQFDELLAEISSCERLQYRPEDLTVRRFAVLVKRLKRHHANPLPPQMQY